MTRLTIDRKDPYAYTPISSKDEAIAKRTNAPDDETIKESGEGSENYRK